MLVGWQMILMDVKLTKTIVGALYLHLIMAQNGYIRNGAHLKIGWIKIIDLLLSVLNVDAVCSIRT